MLCPGVASADVLTYTEKVAGFESSIAHHILDTKSGPPRPQRIFDAHHNPPEEVEK